MLAVGTTSVWAGAYGALAAALSLVIVQWPFVAAAADRLRQLGDRAVRLGLKRAAGWFTVANLACLLVGTYLGPAVSWLWDRIAQPVNDPLFHIEHQAAAVALELLPFCLLSVCSLTVGLWAMNLLPPAPERYRRGSLAALATGQYALAYLIIGLYLWSAPDYAPTLGDYDQVVAAAQVRPELADAPVRLWYVDDDGRDVRSARLDGSDERTEWAGPAPRDYAAFWLVTGQGGSADARLVFAAATELTIVDLSSGQASRHPAAEPPKGATARPPASRDELASTLGVPLGQVWPEESFRSCLFGRSGEISARARAEARELDRRQRKDWLSRLGGARRMPEAPLRAAWLDEQDIQPVGQRPWLVANYGRRLMVLDWGQGRVIPLDLSAEAFILVPDEAWPPATQPDRRRP